MTAEIIVIANYNLPEIKETTETGKFRWKQKQEVLKELFYISAFYISASV